MLVYEGFPKTSIFFFFSMVKKKKKSLNSHTFKVETASPKRPPAFKVVYWVLFCIFFFQFKKERERGIRMERMVQSSNCV